MTRRGDANAEGKLERPRTTLVQNHHWTQMMNLIKQLLLPDVVPQSEPGGPTLLGVATSLRQCSD